ncbi:MAG: hypothetical protein IJP95_07445 [Bacteroidales bacterium]|nr:hypothetical protein [Bacteroidales bacterium]
MKKILYISMIGLVAITLFANFSTEKGVASKADVANAIDDKSQAYVNLGLKSGTKWKTANEYGFYDQEAAIKRYGAQLPTYAQWAELWKFCKWQWTNNGYRITGPNGNSIFLPAEGSTNCDGAVSGISKEGWYLSSSKDGSVTDIMFFTPGFVNLSSQPNCYKMSVRLVKSGK